MTAKVLKRSRAKLVSKQVVEQVGISLQALPEKIPDTLSLRQTIERLRDPIEAALSKGYSYDELVPMLAQQGINIQPSTLKRYVLSGGDRAARRRSTTGKSTQQTRKPRGKSADAADLEVELPIDLELAESEAPASRKRGQTKAKTSSEETESQPEPAKQSRSRRSPARTSSATRSRSTATRGRKGKA